MEHRRRESSTSSSGSLESSEINDDFAAPDTKDPLPSGRTNANLWRDVVEEQGLDEQMRSGSNLVDGELTKRGAETYELPAFDKMDPEEVVKAQQFVNESLKRVIHAHNDDLFNPTEDIDNEYGTQAKRFKKRTVLSDRIPIASADAERMRQESGGAFRRPRYDASNTDGASVKSVKSGFARFGAKKSPFAQTSVFGATKKPASSTLTPSQKFPSTTSLSSSEHSSFSKANRNNKNRKRTSNGSTVRKEDLPIPVHLLADDFTPEKFFATEFAENDGIDDDELGRRMAQALGDLSSEMIMYAVKAVGQTCALRIFKRTQEVERSGGMHVNNQSRRRTPGGVFLKLLRSDKFIPSELRDDVRNFGDRLRQLSKEEEQRANAALPVLPSAAEVHQPILDTAMDTGP